MTQPTAQSALKEALRTRLGPFLRAEGLKGSGNSWTLRGPEGDVAVVNVQSSSFSSSDEVLCVINLAVAPEPWLAWQSEQFGRSFPKAVKEFHGLWRDRLYPSTEPRLRGSEAWWSVRELNSAADAVSDMETQLRSNEGLPLLRELVVRDGMMRAVRAGDLGHMKADALPGFFDRVTALLLADEGPSEELDALVSKFESQEDPQAVAHNEKFLPWLAARAKTARLRRSL